MIPLSAKTPDEQRLEREKALRTEELLASIGTFEDFCALVDIVTKSGGGTDSKQKLAPFNRAQARINLRWKKRKWILILKARQQGITTLEVARDLYFLLTRKNARVLIVCPSGRNDEIMRQVADILWTMIEGLRKAGLRLEFRSESRYELQLDDRNAKLSIVGGGASEATAKKAARSKTTHRIHVTEAAVFEYADLTMASILATLPHDGEICIESTANGAHGYFYETCKAALEGRGTFEFIFLPWYATEEYAIPLKKGEQISPQTEREKFLAEKGCSQAQLKWYRRQVELNGQDLTDQEYPSDPLTCFLVSGRRFFDIAATNRLATKISPPIEIRTDPRLAGEIRIWRKYDPDRREKFVLAVDSSHGIGQDASAAVMMSRKTGEHVATIDGQIPPGDLAQVSATLAAEYGMAEIAVERAEPGMAVIVALERIANYPNLYTHDDDRIGWVTSTTTRPVILDGMGGALRKDQLHTRDAAVVSQIRTFVIVDGKPQAAKTKGKPKDDLVLAYAIANEIVQRVGNSQPTGAYGGDSQSDVQSRWGTDPSRYY